MTQVSKNDVNQIFASNAPEQDRPPSFPNYTTGWGTSRNNNGKPTIKGFNFLQQRSDQNFLWIHQNGGALPYDSSIEYVDSAIVVKDGRISKLVNGSWVDVLKSENPTALPQYYDSSITYQIGSRIMLDDNSGFVVSDTANNSNNPNTNMDGWVLQSATSITTSNGINADTWLKNTVITPDLFLTQAGNDDLKAFYLACDKANSLNIPVTFLARKYNINGQIDLRKATYGIATSSNRFSATILFASSNPNKDTVFVMYRNMDRTSLGRLRIDVNGMFSVGLDTSYDAQIGPSLNITFEMIWIRGYVDIAWLAENNNDVYWKSCMIVEPSSKATKSVVTLKSSGVGGPVQLICCNLLGGKAQFAGQHITPIDCVFSGVEFMGGSWNVYSAIGTHHFGSLDTNSCFSVNGEIRGFVVNGGLCEANNGGYLFEGIGANNILTGSFEFNATQVKADQGEMYLSKGTVGTKFGTTIAKFNGGLAVLNNPNSLGFFDDVSYESTNNGTIVTTKKVIASSGDLRQYETGYGIFSADRFANLNDAGVFYTPNKFYFLDGSGGYFGIVSAYSNVVAQGILKVMSSDSKNYAEYRLSSSKSSDGNSINYSMTELLNTTSGTNKFNAYYDGGNIQIILDNDSGTSGTKRLYFSFEGFIGKL